MINYKGLLFCFMGLFLLSCQVAGQKVESPAYNQMLSSLLSHTVQGSWRKGY